MLISSLDVNVRALKFAVYHITPYLWHHIQCLHIGVLVREGTCSAGQNLEFSNSNRFICISIIFTFAMSKQLPQTKKGFKVEAK